MNHCKLRPALLTLVLASPALAGEAHQGANTVATGGASTASLQDNSAVSASPGSLALVERYDGMGFASLGPGLDHRFGVSAVDSRTSNVAFGISYRRANNNLPVTDSDLPGWIAQGEVASNKEQSHDVTVAVGVPTADRRFAFGINGTFLGYQRERRGGGFTGNIDLGAAAVPSPYITVALTGRNLLYFIDDEDLPLAGVLGLRLGDKDRFQSLSDFEYSTQTGATFRTGLDGSAGPLRLRGGYAWDGELKQNQVSWGLGIENEAGAFEYAMRIPVTGNSNGLNGLLHTISLRVFPPNLEIKEPR